MSEHEFYWSHMIKLDLPFLKNQMFRIYIPTVDSNALIISLKNILCGNFLIILENHIHTAINASHKIHSSYGLFRRP